MPKIAGPPLRKVTLNLFDEDVEWYSLYYGQGWSTAIRDAVHREVNHLKQLSSEDTEYGGE